MGRRGHLSLLRRSGHWGEGHGGLFAGTPPSRKWLDHSVLGTGGARPSGPVTQGDERLSQEAFGKWGPRTWCFGAQPGGEQLRSSPGWRETCRGDLRVGCESAARSALTGVRVSEAGQEMWGPLAGRGPLLPTGSLRTV